MATYDELRAVQAVSDWEPVSELDGASVGYYVLSEDFGALSAGHRVAAVEYHDTGIIMTPADWQASPPDLADPEAIAGTRWQDEDGKPGIVEDGLPVKALYQDPDDPDLTITMDDVDRAVRRARRRGGDDLANMLTATTWEGEDD